MSKHNFIPGYNNVNSLFFLIPQLPGDNLLQLFIQFLPCQSHLIFFTAVKSVTLFLLTLLSESIALRFLSHCNIDY